MRLIGLVITLLVVKVRDADYERAFARIASERDDGLLVLASPVLTRDSKRVIGLAAKHRLPAMHEWREQATDGGLMAYGSSISTLSKRVAAYVDRVLKGATPAQLPLEQATIYELPINARTAKALGLTIPQSVLVRADQVIERSLLYGFALFLGACSIANTPQQELAYGRWAKCNSTAGQLERVDLDGRITFRFTGAGGRQEILQCLAEAGRTGPPLPEPVGVGLPGGP